jgi:hypothetical protein
VLGKVSNQFGYSVDLDKLFRDTLQALTGRSDIELRFEAPPSRGALASVARDLDNHLVVWVSDRLPLNAQYQLLLHEAAHVRLHAAQLPRSTAAAIPAGHLVNVARESRQPDYLREEGEADRLRDTWLAYADRHAWRALDNDITLSGFPPEVYQLTVLKGWKK